MGPANRMRGSAKGLERREIGAAEGGKGRERGRRATDGRDGWGPRRQQLDRGDGKGRNRTVEMKLAAGVWKGVFGEAGGETHHQKETIRVGF